MSKHYANVQKIELTKTCNRLTEAGQLRTIQKIGLSHLNSRRKRRLNL